MKQKFKAVAKAVVAAFSSPQVVKVEEKVAVFVATRVIISLGGSAGAVAGVYEVAKALGWT